MQPINKEIERLLTRQFFVNPAAINKATKFIKHLKFSYLELIELVVLVELKFNITFADSEIEQLKRIGDLDRLLIYTQNR